MKTFLHSFKSFSFQKVFLKKFRYNSLIIITFEQNNTQKSGKSSIQHLKTIKYPISKKNLSIELSDYKIIQNTWNKSSKYSKNVFPRFRFESKDISIGLIWFSASMNKILFCCSSLFSRETIIAVILPRRFKFTHKITHLLSSPHSTIINKRVRVEKIKCEIITM